MNRPCERIVGKRKVLVSASGLCYAECFAAGVSRCSRYTLAGDRALDLIMADGRRRVGFFGLSFKSGTDDLRESPMVELAERLVGKGFDLRIHDSNVTLAKVVGANRAYVTEKLPHLSELLIENAGAVIDHGQILVVGSNTPEVLAAIATAPTDRLLIDLVRLPDPDRLRFAGSYRGIAW